MSDNNLTAAIDFHAQALSLRSERQKVIANNIANADTPKFKASDFDFARTLAQATGTRTAGTTTLATTATGHIGSGQTASLTPGGESTVRLQYRTVGQPSLDGNTVDSDVEQARFADNTVRYEASLRFLNGHIKTIMSAISGQGQ